MRARTSSAGLGAHQRRRDQVDLLDPRQREALERPVGADEVGDEVVGRAGQELGGRGVLHQPALAHDRDAVGHLDALVDVVAHEDDGLRDGAVQAQEVVLQALARDRVDCGERLVHEHHRRVARQRLGEADALLLAARELGGVAAGELVRVEADELEQPAHPHPYPLFSQPSSLGTVATLAKTVRWGSRPTCWIT